MRYRGDSKIDMVIAIITVILVVAYITKEFWWR